MQNHKITKSLIMCTNRDLLEKSINRSAREARKTDPTVLAQIGLRYTLWAFELVVFEVELKKERIVDTREKFTTARELFRTLQDVKHRVLFDCNDLILLTVGKNIILQITERFACQNLHICNVAKHQCRLVKRETVLSALKMMDGGRFRGW